MTAQAGEVVSIAPATGETVFCAPAGDVDHAVERARKAWPGWAAQPLANRIEFLRRFANELRKDAEPLARMVAQETGKPMWEATAEVDAVIARVEIAIRAHAERCPQRKLDNGLNGFTAVRHKPHGVMAAITPFSQPVLVPAGHIIPALIAGNVVILKPSEKTTGSAELLVKCALRTGMPAPVLQLLAGGPEQGHALAMHEGVNGVLFTGSAQVGISLNRKLAARPDKLVALELGGNNPLVVWNTPKVEEAAILVIQSAFANAGQRCTAARRLVVKATLYDELMETLKRLTDRLICGAPFDEPAPFMGPVIDNATADGLAESFIALLSAGGRPIRHMKRRDPALPFVAPAIIDVTAIAELSDMELFGPLLQVIRVDDFDEALSVANATRYGLAAGLIGGSPQEYNRFWANVRAGQVSWNRAMTADVPGAPLGGVGVSGNHHPGSFYAADRCAYPVSSLELEQPRTTLGVGFS
ncbi:MAG: succinylglutamate-semialdehyde dehydrogenase [Sphingomonadales bacterium]|nr:succinylglutamate-semialdehyde dehydrogenase [Sphingomonadales bacterium]